MDLVLVLGETGHAYDEKAGGLRHELVLIGDVVDLLQFDDPVFLHDFINSPSYCYIYIYLYIYIYI